MVIQNNLITDVAIKIHNEIIAPVESKEISIDEGFGKLIRTLYGVNSYLSISLAEKLEFLQLIANITHAVKNENDTDNYPVHFLFNNFLSLNNISN